MRLDPLLRDTVVLVAGEDMNHAEAALALGVAESTISWRTVSNIALMFFSSASNNSRGLPGSIAVPAEPPAAKGSCPVAAT